ncbi:MAG: TIGR03545 family protein [Planctomycetota bacterium]
MARWTYLIPRIIILGLILLGVWVGADPLTRNVIIGGLQSATGSRVEVGHLRCSLENEKVIIKDLAIADPSDPMTNLAQADMVYLEFDYAQLLQRKFRITKAQTSRLMFNTPRTSPGQLDGQVVTAKTPLQSIPASSVSSAKIGQRWLDQLEPVSTSLAAIENENLFNAAKSLDQTWTQRLDQIESQIRQIQNQTNDVSQTYETFDGNILRWKSNNYVVLNEISGSASTLTQTLETFQQQVAIEIAELNQAVAADANRIESSIKTTSFDENDMSQLLLAKLHADYVDQVINMFRWFQHAMPEPSEDFAPKFKRGIDVPIQGITQSPRFVAENVQLNGEGRFLDQHYNFAGNAFNLSTEPELLSEPTRFELRAQGQQHVFVNCVLDRRNGTATDSLSVICPELAVSTRILGDPSSLQVTLGPAGKLQANIQLKTTDGKLSGSIVLRHSNVSLHVDKLNELAGGEPTALQMNQGGLGLIKEFESRIELSGTLDDYQHNATSDLGIQFSSAVNKVLKEKKSNAIAQRQQMLQKTKSLQLQSINESIVKRLQSLKEQIQQNGVRVAELKNIRPSGSKINEYWR